MDLNQVSVYFSFGKNMMTMLVGLVADNSGFPSARINRPGLDSWVSEKLGKLALRGTAPVRWLYRHI